MIIEQGPQVVLNIESKHTVVVDGQVKNMEPNITTFEGHATTKPGRMGAAAEYAATTGV